MQNLLTVLIANAQQTSGLIHAETDYKESAKCIVLECDGISLITSTRVSGDSVYTFGIELELGYQILMDCMNSEIESMHIEASKVHDVIAVEVIFEMGTRYTIKGLRHYAE
jgi:hypothetical protein